MSHSILVMDDDPGACSYLRDLLVYFGYRVEAVSSVNGAIDRLKQRPFDALLIDYYLPEQTGIELLDWLKEEGRKEPAVVMSGMADYDMMMELMGRGAIDLISKPVQPAQLRRALKVAIDKSSDILQRH